MIRSLLRRARRDDGGFTLPELIVSIVVLAFIMGAIGLTLIVVLRNTSAATDRVTAGGSAQTLSMWFPADAQSARAERASFTTERASGCGDDRGSMNKLLLYRAEGGANDLVSYRLSQTPSGDYDLWRVSCIGGNWARRVVVQGIVDPALVKVEAVTDTGARVTTLDGDATIVQIDLTATVGRSDPVDLHVSGTPRSKGPATACTAEGGPSSIQLGAGGVPPGPVVLTADTNGVCMLMRAEVDGGAISMPLSGGPNTWASDPRTGDPWTVGAHTVQVFDNAHLAGTFTIDVLPEPCQVLDVTGGPLRVESNGRVSALQTLTIVGASTCTITQVGVHRPDGSTFLRNADPSASLIPGQFDVDLRAGDGPFSLFDGSLPDAALDAYDGARLVGTVNLGVVYSSCSVVPDDPRNTRLVLVTPDASHLPLHNPVTLSVVTRGNCVEEMLATPPLSPDVNLDGGPTLWSSGQVNGVAWQPSTTPLPVAITSAGTAAGTLPVLVHDCALASTDTIRLEEKDGFADKDLRFETTGICGPGALWVRFTLPDNTIVERQADPSGGGGGGGGGPTEWQVETKGWLRLGDEPVTVQVFDADSAATADLAAQLADTFLVRGEGG